MKKAVYLLLPMLAISLSSCGKYSSHYKAFILVTTQHTDHGSIRFHEFEGQYVFNFRKTSSGEGAISYSATLKEGQIDVSYVVLGTESLLFSIKNGETYENKGGYIEKNQKVKVIVRSNCKSIDGDFSFNLN